MEMFLFKILFFIAAFVAALSAAFFLISFFATDCTGKAKKRMQKGTATLVRVTKDRQNGSQGFQLAYTCDGTELKVMVSQEHVEGISPMTPDGTQVPIWYDPQKPKRVIIAEDLSMEKTMQSWKRIRKRSLILMLIFGCITMYALPHSEQAPGLPRLTMTPIGQFREEIAALADQTPTALAYTESIGSPETFSVTVDDPAIAKKVLDMILSTSVNRLGCQMDMYQLQYEEYRFVFGEDTYTFSFVPRSYFCYGGKYYELGENRLNKVRDFLHEMAAEAGALGEPQSKWYGKEAVLRARFVDNEDEARSLTELTLTAGGECLTGILEGAYDVLSVDRQPDGYVIRYTYGDFYSHETIRISRVTVENGEMIIADMAQ